MVSGYIERLANKPVSKADGDYEVDGILYCGKCHTPKQLRIKLLGIDRVVPCMCDCRKKAVEEEDRREKEKQFKERAEARRKRGIQSEGMRESRFEKDDHRDAKISNIARRYVAKWDAMYENGQGILLSGGVGCGKTFLAGCIANAVIDKGYSAVATSFPQILMAMQSNIDKMEYMKQLLQCDLLVVDDLGAERQSDFALEQVYAVVNGRYESKKPVIFTTNIPIAELRNPRDARYSRIYDRILEVCVPFHMSGESRRAKNAKENAERMKRILMGEEE